MTTFEEQTYDYIDFTIDGLPKGKYDYCKFINCNFSEVDLSSISFVECEFTGCNWSLCKTVDTALQDVTFKHCKLLGIHFDTCDNFLLQAQFEHCQLDNSVFYQVDLRKIKFQDCRLIEVDLSEADCSKMGFDMCILEGAVFDHTNLEGADFRNAIGFIINPEQNRLRGAKFDKMNLAGLLHQYHLKID